MSMEENQILPSLNHLPPAPYTPVECSQTKDPAFTFRVKNKSSHPGKLYLFSSPVSHVTDTLFVKTWGGKSYAKSVACEQIPSDISITHAVPARQLPWKAVARSSTEQQLSTGTLPYLPLDLHPWQLLLAAIVGFPFNSKVSPSLVTSLCIFPFSSLQWLQVALLSFLPRLSILLLIIDTGTK